MDIDRDNTYSVASSESGSFYRRNEQEIQQQSELLNSDVKGEARVAEMNRRHDGSMGHGQAMAYNRFKGLMGQEFQQQNTSRLP